MEGWQKHYPGMVEWQDPKMHGGVKSVDPKTMTVKTDLAEYKAQLVNVIPAQMAGKIARDAGLANQTGFCPINPENMKSTMDANIYVVGDACIPGDMPKSAFSANSQAKVAAMMIRGELAKSQTFPARYTNTCWSLIETDDTVKVGGSYEAKDGKIAAVETFVSKTGESADLRKQTQQENMGWYSGIIGRHLCVMTDCEHEHRRRRCGARSASPRRFGGAWRGAGARPLLPCRRAPRRRRFAQKLGSFEISVVSDGTLQRAALLHAAGHAGGRSRRIVHGARHAAGRPRRRKPMSCWSRPAASSS